MWIRRTPKEIAEFERRHRLSRYHPGIPFLIGVGAGVFVSTLRWMGYQGRSLPMTDPISLREAVFFLPVYFAYIFTTVFFATYAVRIFSKQTPPRDGIQICPQCFEAADQQAPKDCPCGGKREPFYHWRWQRDDLKRM